MKINILILKFFNLNSENLFDLKTDIRILLFSNLKIIISIFKKILSLKIGQFDFKYFYLNLKFDI